MPIRPGKAAAPQTVRSRLSRRVGAGPFVGRGARDLGASGQRDVFWRRLPDDSRRVEAAGAKSLGDKDTVPLGRDIIHSVTNPIDRLTGAIHVYGGDFFNANRSEWDPASLLERPCDPQRLVAIFEEENRRLATLT